MLLRTIASFLPLALVTSQPTIKLSLSPHHDNGVWLVDFTPPTNQLLKDVEYLNVYFDSNDNINVTEFKTFQKSHYLQHQDHHFVGASDNGDTLQILLNVNNHSLVTGSMSSFEDGLVFQLRPDAQGNNLAVTKKSSDFIRSAPADWNNSSKNRNLRKRDTSSASISGYDPLQPQMKQQNRRRQQRLYYS
jgi:hypothetical protein